MSDQNAGSPLVGFVLMAGFTSGDPVNGVLSRSQGKPSSHAWFGHEVQGRDGYARVIYGARASIVCCTG
ncbi:hypothetical protein C5N14_20750 [Micromonospora sp. MW-13]|uniref:hypothetical protein n=1 Tax=Micromonospora sp. MW-13 TaxID=2094022 RepID=UPI000ED08358|nr:hypothetical protein [Micromonospora sp. MW-13]RGC66885.1 hypothetical protein C5N14_20750 [Micromonospora sp. MW-13]